jgi:hypothetical protein
MWKILATAAAVVVGGCAQKVQVDVTTDEASLAPFRVSGPGSVTGQAFLRQQGGGVVTCAGSQVFLSPDLPPLHRVLSEIREGHQVEATGTKWGNAGRTATCDAGGNFKFEGLPPADWYVMTEVRWMVGYYAQGGTLAAPVSTKDGHHEVMLTDASAVR